MGGDEDLGAVLHEVLEGGDGGADAGVIGDHAVLEGDVEVAAHEHSLALEIVLLEVADGLLLGLNRRRRGALVTARALTEDLAKNALEESAGQRR